MTIFNISYDDVCRSSTLELSDMGKQADIMQGCIQIIGSGDGPVLCPDDFLISSPFINPNNGKANSFNRGKMNSKTKTMSKIVCADNIWRRIYHNQNGGYFYINVKNVKMRIHSSIFNGDKELVK